jgi:hypothetical protein
MLKTRYLWYINNMKNKSFCGISRNFLRSQRRDLVNNIVLRCLWKNSRPSSSHARFLALPEITVATAEICQDLPGSDFSVTHNAHNATLIFLGQRPSLLHLVTGYC